ncbi:MAG: penicillin-binding protein activator LpoB [Syntrophobacteraceae bacterium]|nr:penicillin-binding protein activator LpoB [Syntrophobacteraceae bacterium]
MVMLSFCLLFSACAAKPSAPPMTGESQQRASTQASTQPSPQQAADTQKKPQDGPVPIAVWDLDDLASQEMAQPELGELLSSKVMETIEKKGGYQVIDKSRLAAARKELRLEKAIVSDPTVRLQLGRALGARQMVFGGYQVMEGKMKLELHLLEVETGRIVKSTEESAPASSISGWLDAAQRAAAALL